MGTSSSPEQLAAKLRQYANAVIQANSVGVTEAAKVAKRNIEVAQGKPVLIVPRAKNKRVAPFYKLLSSGEQSSALVGMRGAAPLVEKDTKPHRIPKQGRKRKLLAIPGIGVRASAQHPGTKGKHPFRRGVEATRLQVGPKIAAQVHKAGVSVFH